MHARVSSRGVGPALPTGGAFQRHRGVWGVGAHTPLEGVGKALEGRRQGVGRRLIAWFPFGRGWAKRQLSAFARRGAKDFDVDAVVLEQLGHRAGERGLRNAVGVRLARENGGRVAVARVGRHAPSLFFEGLQEREEDSLGLGGCCGAVVDGGAAVACLRRRRSPPCGAGGTPSPRGRTAPSSRSGCAESTSNVLPSLSFGRWK